jgi:hypothetical protein
MKGHKNRYGDSGYARMTTVKRMTTGERMTTGKRMTTGERMTIRKEEIRKED